MMLPSRRKKKVAKRTSTVPVNTSARVAAVERAPLVNRSVLLSTHRWVSSMYRSRSLSDRCRGPVLSQSWICCRPWVDFAVSSGTPLMNSLTTRVSVPITAASPVTRTTAVASDRGRRARSSQPTAGASNADSNSATARGMITMLIVPTSFSSAQKTMPMTISRQHQAAAIRSACGTSASSRLEVELCTGAVGSAPTTVAAAGAAGPGLEGEATVADSGTSDGVWRPARTDSRPDSYARRSRPRIRSKRLKRTSWQIFACALRQVGQDTPDPATVGRIRHPQCPVRPVR